MPRRRTHIFDVRDHGAKGDRAGNDTAAIQKAVDACHAAGGGDVVVPAGDYLAAGVALRGNVALRLEAGATLWAATDEESYAAAPHKSLLYADDAVNVSVFGPGRIHGQGYDAERPPFRPQMIHLAGCRDVRLEGFTIELASQWTIHLVRCDTVMLRGLTIRNNLQRLNTDGIDPDCSRNVHISDCHIVAGDDCIVVKTTQPGACEDIVVSNCTLETTCAALKIGTETRGDVRNVLFSNCVIRNTRAALALYMKDGGTIENVAFSNVVVETGGGHEFPIFASIERRFPETPLGRIRNVRFAQVLIRTRGRCWMEGAPESPIENVSLSDVSVVVHSPEDIGEGRPPRGAARVAPETAIHECAAVPAALLFGHVRGLALRNVSVEWAADAGAADRHALYVAHASDVSLEGVRCSQASADSPLAAMRLKQCDHAIVRGCQAANGTGVFLEVDTPTDENLVFAANDVARARRALRHDDGLPPGTVVV